MELAVIKSGGKQYLVAPGQKIDIEKVSKKEGEEIVFSEVLLLKKGEIIEIGKPIVKGAKVVGRILKQKKGEKITILKHKPRKRYRIKKGHRQLISEVEIITLDKKR